MSYSDGKFQARVMNLVSPSTSWGTSTASSATGHNTTGVVVLPKFIRATEVGAIRMRCTVIPDAGSTAVKANFLNGTNTFGVVTLTTATAQAQLDGVMTAANASFAADGQPTVNLVGTATATADASGSWEIWFENKENFS